MKFKYMGEFNGRTEWGEIEAASRAEALAQLKASKISVQRLTDASGKGGVVRPEELLGALVGERAGVTLGSDHNRWLKVMDNWEKIHRMDPHLIAKDPKAQRLLKGAAECEYPDVASRARVLLGMPTQDASPLSSPQGKQWWHFWK